jgi:iron-sulfur cluster assembly protein
MPSRRCSVFALGGRTRSPDRSLHTVPPTLAIGDKRSQSGARSPIEPEGRLGVRRCPILTITEEAATLIGTLSAKAQLPEQGGLRIGIDSAYHSLSMALVHAPQKTEAVIASRGARVFLPIPVARRLVDRTLRAEITEARSLFFLDE